MTKTILIADDDEMVLSAIRFFLKNRKYNVLLASGGAEAFELIKASGKVDIVISDIQMPDGDGVELLNKTQKLPSAPPVILMSGHAHTTSEDCLRLGAKAFLPKPFDPDELTLCLNHCLESQAS
jgi:two-component system response regulator HydG